MYRDSIISFWSDRVESLKINHYVSSIIFSFLCRNSKVCVNFLLLFEYFLDNGEDWDRKIANISDLGFKFAERD